MQRAEQRLVGHINTINLDCLEGTSAPVGRHFRDMPGHSHSDVQFTPFEKIRSRDPFIRKARERHLINVYGLFGIWTKPKFVILTIVINFFAIFKKNCLKVFFDDSNYANCNFYFFKNPINNLFFQKYLKMLNVFLAKLIVEN